MATQAAFTRKHLRKLPNIFVLFNNCLQLLGDSSPKVLPRGIFAQEVS